MNIRLICLLCAVCAICGCTQDAYDKGEGRYSLMQADFVEIHADASRQADYIVTDDGDLLTVSPTFTSKWITTPDSLYRCTMYYNKVRANDGSLTAEPLSVGLVPCPRIKSPAEVEGGVKADPVRFESAWLSRSGRYLNLSLYVMNGTADDADATHTISIVADTLAASTASSSGSAGDITRLILHHDQGGVPEYYSSHVYISLPADSIATDSVSISIPTYSGLVTKRFRLR